LRITGKKLVLYEGKIQQFGTPGEIFYFPKNLHVAELIGISNVFDDAYAEYIKENQKMQY
jgi:molybdate transport system ATP-binding protein